MPTPKLFATDLDGTLLGPNGEIRDADRAAIRELTRQGVIVTIVTGRMYSGTRDVARSIELSGPICCIDGSAIVAVDGDRDLVFRPITSTASRALQAAVVDAKPAAFVLCRDEIVHDASAASFVPYVRAWSPRFTPVGDIGVTPHWNDANDVSGVIAVGSKEQIDAIVTAVGREAPDLVAPVAFAISREEFRGHWAMVARAAGATKGTALEWIAAHYGIPMRDVVAVGDWRNDVPMFRVAGRSFVMAHAIDEVKAAASDVLRADVTTGGGIAEAAERSGLL